MTRATQNPQFSQFLIEKNDQLYYNQNGDVYPGSFDPDLDQYGSDPAFPLMWNYGFTLHRDGPLFLDSHSMSGTELLGYLQMLMENGETFQYFEGTRNIDMSSGESLGGNLYFGVAVIKDVSMVPEPNSLAICLSAIICGVVLFRWRNA